MDTVRRDKTIFTSKGRIMEFIRRLEDDLGLTGAVYIDLAEQSLQALGKLATDHGRALFRSGGLMAVLSYLDFFPTGVQRSAMQTAAAMCRTAPPECFNMVKEACWI